MKWSATDTAVLLWVALCFVAALWIGERDTRIEYERVLREMPPDLVEKEFSELAQRKAGIADAETRP
jgi:hypothetical protein